MNTLVKTIDKSNIGNEFLRTLNGIMGLSQRELELLSRIMDIQLSASRGRPGYSDNSQNRKRLMSETGITSDNMSKYMKIFRKKGILVYDNDRLVINRALIPVIIGGNKIQITLILKINKDEQNTEKQ